VRGKRVAILEARLGAELAGLVERRGARVLRAPALAEAPDIDPAAVRALVASLGAQAPRLAIFQTGVGTEALFAAADALGVARGLRECLAAALIAARGPKPAGALRARGLRVDRSAAEPYTTHELLASIADVPLRGERVLVQRHGASNAELDRALRTRGAEVLEVPTYRWSLPADTQPLSDLVDALQRGEVDAAVFTNAEQVRNLFTVARGLGRERALRDSLNRTLVASIGPIASAALRAAEVNIGVEAKPPKLGALLSALDRALS
jgi:uroporphyrinogen-III synthase